MSIEGLEPISQAMDIALRTANQPGREPRIQQLDEEIVDSKHEQSAILERASKLMRDVAKKAAEVGLPWAAPENAQALLNIQDRVAFLTDISRKNAERFWRYIDQLDPIQQDAINLTDPLTGNRSGFFYPRESTGILPYDVTSKNPLINRDFTRDKDNITIQYDKSAEQIKINGEKYSAQRLIATLQGTTEVRALYDESSVGVCLRNQETGQRDWVVLTHAQLRQLRAQLITQEEFSKAQEAPPPAPTQERSRTFTVTAEEYEKLKDPNVTKIRGAEYSQRGQLSLEELYKAGLGPAYRISDGIDVNWYVSEPYWVDGRTAFTAYVEQNRKFIVRSYYISSSTGLVRYLPAYIPGEDMDISIYFKGYGEESITLPASAQKSLGRIAINSQRRGTQKLFDNRDAQFYFAGTARHVGQTTTYDMEIDRMAGTLDRDFVSRGYNKIPPENLVLKNAKDNPNFDGQSEYWEMPASIYSGGKVTVRTFKSYNGMLKYLFCQDEQNRVWVGAVEALDQPITSTGLKRVWINAGDLTTPGAEYFFPGHDQTGGYGNFAERLGSQNQYVDMSTKYTSKIPMVAALRAKIKI